MKIEWTVFFNELLNISINTIMCFFYGWGLYLTYHWFSWNFNLPEATYFEMVAFTFSIDFIGGILRSIVHKK